jgi:hypothetical protein
MISVVQRLVHPGRAGIRLRRPCGRRGTAVPPRHTSGDGLMAAGYSRMLHLQHACSQVAASSPGSTGTGHCAMMRPFVIALIDAMHGGTGHAAACREHCLVHAPAVHAGPAERRQQRGMDVHHAAAIRRSDGRRHQPQVAGQGHQSMSCCFSAASVSWRIIPARPVGDVQRRHARRSGALQCAGILPIGDDQRDRAAPPLGQTVQQACRLLPPPDTNTATWAGSRQAAAVVRDEERVRRAFVTDGGGGPWPGRAGLVRQRQHDGPGWTVDELA